MCTGTSYPLQVGDPHAQEAEIIPSAGFVQIEGLRSGWGLEWRKRIIQKQQEVAESRRARASGEGEENPGEEPHHDENDKLCISMSDAKGVFRFQLPFHLC